MSFPRLCLNGGITGDLIPSLSPPPADSGFFNIFYEQVLIL